MNQIAALTVDASSTPTHQVAPVKPGADAFLAMIERAARDPAVDVDKMDRLMQMRERMMAQIAEREYSEAMSAMQPELPVVQQNGMITIYGKDDVNKVKPPIQTTKFARWEDINEAIVPVLSKHGFSLTFGAAKDGDRVVVTGTVRHRGGHKEQTTLSLALDTSGSKNNVQAVGSSISYGKRYAAGLLLNITSRAKGDADDDGKAAGDHGAEAITSEQAVQLRSEMQDRGINEEKFCDYAGYPLDEMPAKDFAVAMQKIKLRKKVQR